MEKFVGEYYSLVICFSAANNLQSLDETLKFLFFVEFAFQKCVTFDRLIHAESRRDGKHRQHYY